MRRLGMHEPNEVMSHAIPVRTCACRVTSCACHITSCARAQVYGLTLDMTFGWLDEHHGAPPMLGCVG